MNAIFVPLFALCKLLTMLIMSVQHITKNVSEPISMRMHLRKN